MTMRPHYGKIHTSSQSVFHFTSSELLHNISFLQSIRIESIISSSVKPSNHLRVSFILTHLGLTQSLFLYLSPGEDSDKLVAMLMIVIVFSSIYFKSHHPQ